MTHLTAVLSYRLSLGPGLKSGPIGRMMALLLLLALALSSRETFHVTLDALSEAYLAVSVFVAGTLALVYGLERALRSDIGCLLSRYGRWQIPAAAFLGAFPGCGGAIVVITQYTKGHLSFGAVVAALTATMGDAMFLLLAKEPTTAALVYAVGLVVGSLSGLLVDWIHGPGFLRARTPAYSSSDAREIDMPQRPFSLAEGLWLALAVPGLAVGLALAFQVDVAAWLGFSAGSDPVLWLGVGGAVLALTLWAGVGNLDLRPKASRNGAGAPASIGDTARRIIDDTNFITAWVVFAFVGYELAVTLLDLDLSALFAVAAPIVPLIAVLVGFIPGCGPQIVVTALYLGGALPLSAQLGNAISNDGDALFPAIALAPKAALVATLYSAAPAILIAYSTYLGWEANLF